MGSLRRSCFCSSYMLFCIIFLCVVEASAGEASGEIGSGGAAQKTFQYDPGAEIQNEFLGQMREIDRDLKNEHANFAKNYTATATLYERLQSDWKAGAETPQNVIVDLQNLLREKEKIQARIDELDKKKAALKSSISSHYDRNIPGTLQQAVDEVEKKYKADVDEIYLQLGWWLQTQRPEFGPRDEMSLRRNILRHYHERGKAEE